MDYTDDIYDTKRFDSNQTQLSTDHFPFRPFSLCDSVLPAAVFDALLVLPSRRVFEAAVAAPADVVFEGACRCDNALPEEDLVVLPVEPLRSVFNAAVPAFFPVTFFMIKPLTL